jgi:hypothetical protein
MLKPLMVVVIVITLTLFVSAGILGQFSSLRLIGTRGIVKVIGVGVYWDANCTSLVSSLNWGTIEPGTTKNFTVFIRNEGNVVATLFKNETNWSPVNASAYISLEWDYDDHTINPSDTTQTTLTLMIAPDAQGVKDFNFDIAIGING